FLTSRHQPRSTLFPYTTLFRSSCRRLERGVEGVFSRHVPPQPRMNLVRSAHVEFLIRRVHVVVRQQHRGAEERIAQQRAVVPLRSEEHTSELQSRGHLVCRLLL